MKNKKLFPLELKRIKDFTQLPDVADKLQF